MLSPSVLVSLVFVYGFMLLTGYLSFTGSTLMPRYTFVGLNRYRDLFANEVWWASVANLAWFTVPFIASEPGFGLLLAILLDQRIRGKAHCERCSSIRWRCRRSSPAPRGNGCSIPALGIERAANLGWPASRRWLGDPDLAIFCVVLAAVWQCAGFVAALFLAGLRGIDDEIVKAAQVDGASMPTIYRRVVSRCSGRCSSPSWSILTHLAIKTFDLVVALTAGGPGTSTSPLRCSCTRSPSSAGRLGIGAASAMMMLAAVIAVVVPLMYLEARPREISVIPDFPGRIYRRSCCLRAVRAVADLRRDRHVVQRPR